MKKFKYEVTTPTLPPDAQSPVMENYQLEDWLNEMDEAGWEFISYAQKIWVGGTRQSWWIFKKEVIPK